MALIIQVLELDIKYRPGRSNANADVLSCVPVQCAQVEIDAECGGGGDPESTSHVSLPELAKKQRDDPELAPIFAYLQNGVLPENEVVARRLVLKRSRYSIFCTTKILTYQECCVAWFLCVCVSSY